MAAKAADSEDRPIWPALDDRIWMIEALLLIVSVAATIWAVAAGSTLGIMMSEAQLSQLGGLPPWVPTLGVYAVGVFLAAAALILKPRSIAVRAAAVLVLGFALVTPAVVSPAQHVGDSVEYYQMTSAFMGHLSPDIRPTDGAAVVNQAVSDTWWMDPNDPKMEKALAIGVYTSPGGGRYSYHFWLNSLAVAPFALVLKALNTPWLRAAQVFNAILILVAFYSLLFWSGLRDVKSRVFAAFWILSPVTWYLAWPSAEVWSASFVVLSIAAFTKKRFALATLFAALAATQNPPLLVFVALVAGWGGYLVWKSAGYRGVWPIALAACVGFLPNAFYQVTFGTPSLIARAGEASIRFVSAAKVASLFADLNQGILPYAPALLLLWLVAAGLSVYRKSWFGMALVVATLAMAALAGMTPNWNSGAVGIMRYAVWLLPVMAWSIVGVLRPGRNVERWGLYLLVAGQGLIAAAVLFWPSYVPDFQFMAPVAMYVLEHEPRLYSPVSEIFSERAAHADHATPSSGAIGVVGADGRVLKVLLTDAQVGSVAKTLNVQQSAVRAHMYSAGQSGLFYYDVR